jgi:hypothetical protein
LRRPEPRVLSKGRQEKKKKKQPMSLFGQDFFKTRGVVVFVIAFLSSPYRETPKNAQTKSARGKNVNARPRKTFFITFLSSPDREALNQRNNKNRKKKS